MELFQSVNVLGVEVGCIQRAELFEVIGKWAVDRCSHSIFYVNANCLNIAWGDLDYRRILNQADLVITDGSGVAWASRWLNGCRLQKNTGADLIDPFCELAQAAGWRMYIIAGKPGVAQSAVQTLSNRYPALKIVGFSDGYFQGRSEAEVLSDIARCQPQIVMVGMGVPRQERWIAEHRIQIAAPVCWGVGALFDYVAGLEPRCPAWMNRMGLEWLFRLLVDPVGKWRRYLVGNPVFLFRVLRQKFAMHSV